MKKYLGDGVYAEFDGLMVILSTEGNRIYLEPEVLDALNKFVKALRGEEQ